MKKKKESREEIELPEKIEANLENGLLKIKGKKGETQRNFFHPKIKLSLEGRKIVVASKEKGKKGKKMVGTYVAHIKNMFRGLQEGFVYKLQVCAVHFPMNVAVKNNEVIIKNFLGEAKERKAKILPNVAVKIEKETIIVESADKEAAGQTAANIEKAAQQTTKDKRVFQDGIFIVERAGRKI